MGSVARRALKVDVSKVACMCLYTLALEVCVFSNSRRLFVYRAYYLRYLSIASTVYFKYMYDCDAQTYEVLPLRHPTRRK
jgi:hypothetical protein